MHLATKPAQDVRLQPIFRVEGCIAVRNLQLFRHQPLIWGMSVEDYQGIVGELTQEIAELIEKAENAEGPVFRIYYRFSKSL